MRLFTMIAGDRDGGFARGGATAGKRSRSAATIATINQQECSRIARCGSRTSAFAGRLAVDAGVNGGVSVKGWDSGNVLVRAKVEASGEDDAAARAVVSQIRGGHVGGTGERDGAGAIASGNGWSVSYEIFVPRQGDLDPEDQQRRDFDQRRAREYPVQHDERRRVAETAGGEVEGRP